MCSLQLPESWHEACTTFCELGIGRTFQTSSKRTSGLDSRRYPAPAARRQEGLNFLSTRLGPICSQDELEELWAIDNAAYGAASIKKRCSRGATSGRLGHKTISSAGCALPRLEPFPRPRQRQRHRSRTLYQLPRRRTLLL